MDEQMDRSRLPYGPPIHEATASGDLQRMKATADAARRALYGIEFSQPTGREEAESRSALEALESAIAQLESRPGGGPLPPYGVPIRDAIARGDLSEMKATAAAARAAIHGIQFQPVDKAQLPEVSRALEELERAIAELEDSGR